MKKDELEGAENDHDPAANPPPGKKDAGLDAGKPKKPAPYVFRFLPADPKNALDFEDMADK